MYRSQHYEVVVPPYVACDPETAVYTHEHEDSSHSSPAPCYRVQLAGSIVIAIRWLW